MKYKTIYDMDYREEERNQPAANDGSEVKFNRLLRALSTDFISPAQAELPAASPEEIDDLLRIVHAKRRKRVFLRRWLYGGLAASLILAGTIVFSVFSTPAGGRGSDLPELADAVRHRNTEALFELAGKLKAMDPAKRSSLPDYRTVLSAAAYLAGMQDRRQMRQKIAAAEPGLALGGPDVATRGAGSAGVRLPEIAEVPPEAIARLPKHQYPAWGGYVADYYPELPPRRLRALIDRVNRALLDLDPVELAACAVALSDCQTAPEMPGCFSAKTLFDMAWDIAVAGRDAAAMTQLAEMYRQSPLFDRRTAAEMLAEIKYVSSSRKDGKDPAGADHFKQLRDWSGRQEK